MHRRPSSTSGRCKKVRPVVWLLLGGWPELLTSFGGPRAVTKTRQKQLWATLQTQLVPMWVAAVLIGQWWSPCITQGKIIGSLSVQCSQHKKVQGLVLAVLQIHFSISEHSKSHRWLSTILYLIRISSTLKTLLNHASSPIGYKFRHFMGIRPRWASTLTIRSLDRYKRVLPRELR